MAFTFQVKRGLKNPTSTTGLLAGEFGYNTTDKLLFIGNGVGAAPTGVATLNESGQIHVSMLPETAIHGMEFVNSISSDLATDLFHSGTFNNLEKGQYWISGVGETIHSGVIRTNYPDAATVWGNWKVGFLTETNYTGEFNIRPGDWIVVSVIDEEAETVYLSVINNNATDLYVPLTRKINGSALTSDITLTGASIAATGYSKKTGNLSASDSINTALGKLETKADANASGVSDLWSAVGTNTNTINSMTTNAFLQVASPSTLISNWNTAYGWGNHASAGYIKAHPSISAASSVNNGETSRKYIQDVTLDSNGHVIGLVTGEETYTYTHPTTAGNKHIPSGGAADNILVYSASGTASWASGIDCGSY